MQAAKDTFLKTLAQRLAVVNPARTITMDGVTRPAVATVENEVQLPVQDELEAFLLSWEGAGRAIPEASLMYLDCKISYGSQGSDAMLRRDRGRILTAMDGELMQICHPRCAAKCDYTETLPTALGTNVFWTLPVMEAPSESEGVRLRTATMRLFYFPEGV